ncbi:MAG: response regulator [Chitinophagaceae bacterium]|nr:response regulator [Chitinophagaceae bacterium]
MISPNVNILLADDDQDDCLFFKEALDELQLKTKLTAVHDGEQLMLLLNKKADSQPDLVFLDLNMPRKNGFTCLEEIKRSEKLKSLPVIIFSTSYDESIADLLYKNGAQHYICKPADFSELKKVIHQALTIVSEKNTSQPRKENFLLNTLKAIIL